MGERSRLWRTAGSVRLAAAGMACALAASGCSMVSSGAQPGGDDAAAEAARQRATGLVAEAENAISAGSYDEAVLLLLQVGDDAPQDLRATALLGLREAVAGLTPQQVVEAVEAAPPGLRLQTPLLARYARELFEAGDIEGSRQLAERILAFGAEDTEAELARSILSPEGPPFGRSESRFGAVLPDGPTLELREFSEEIRDGIQLALAFAEAEVDLEVIDDEATAEGALAGVDSLQSSGSFGVIGPLFDDALQALAGQTQVPVVSPTATSVPPGSTGLYTLSGVDVGDARLLGGYAADRGFARVMVVYPNDPDGLLEADAFRAALVERGGQAPLETALDPDTAFFREPLEEIRRQGPDAIALLLSEEQVRTFAPQYTFYGLDSLRAERMGGAAWGSASVLSSVATRHTDGVIVAVPVSTWDETDGYLEFVNRYEQTFQRGLTSDAPALGYDAAMLLLRAAEVGTPSDPIGAFESLREVRGATGILSVDGGRIGRLHQLVRLEGGTAVPIGG